MNIGQFVAAEIIILLVINSVEKIILGLETFYDVLTSVEKIGEVTDLEIESESEVNQTNCFINLSLELENVNFKFEDDTTNALENINLKINQSEKIVIEGDNGSGKTTLIRILSGLIQPTQGHFIINDDTFNKMDINQYRTHFGCILQGETLFEGTIFENLTFNNPNISNEDIKWALDNLKLTSFIKTLPNGLKTPIFPDGKQLSSSNIQKILLARCVLHKPRILFLENPTDKMDVATSQEIIAFLMDPNQKWTVVVTSNNKQFSAKSNRVITMEKGKISNILNK